MGAGSYHATMDALLAQLSSGIPLSEAQSFSVFSRVMGGHIEPEKIAELLTLIARRAVPSSDEVVGAARALRERMVKVDVPAGKVAVDACGTGGDHAGTFNVSTAAAIVAAAAGRNMGLVVAKHGNRSVTSNSGSSQALEALGVTLAADPAVLTRCMERAGIAFLFAPNHHPAMRHAAPVRKALGFRTIFNLLGPLTNPAGARHQVAGVFDRALMPVMAEALLRLGAEKAWVVNGELAPGQRLDELSPLGPSAAMRVEDGRVFEMDAELLMPETLGLHGGEVVELQTPGPAESAALIRQIFLGEETGAPREAVALNAAAVLVVGGAAVDLRHGLALAGAAIDSGAATQTLEELIVASKE